MIELQSITSASSNPITQMLVNGIMNDDQSMVNVAQGAILARASMAQVPEYTANINRIASGLEGQGLQRNNGNDFGVA
jgi:hypothetical protein